MTIGEPRIELHGAGQSAYLSVDARGSADKPGQKGVAEKRDLRMRRLDQGLLPACLIICDNAGPKTLYGTMGDEPKGRTASYLSPVPSHD
ncbi:MAG: hypothetical protein Q8N47_07295 [Bryobacterales bacterium]|nr:hypothetical protein [Bryobacterales bacterium]